MDAETEDPENIEPSAPWSGSDGSRDCGFLESPDESDDEVEYSDGERSLDTQPYSFCKCDVEYQKGLKSLESKLVCKEQSLNDLSGGEEEGSSQEVDIYSYDPGKTAHNKTLPTSRFSKSKGQDPESGQMPRPLTHSSSSSLGHAPEMTLNTEPLGASYRQGQGTGNRRVGSSEEGGSSEVAPATLIFGISDQGAEQAERRNPGFDTGLCKQDSHQGRYTRLGQDESQSQRQVKENKSKCQRIARLLTEAHNPQNKGALLFKKRQQRVKKYTLVSYGTGDSKFDSQEQLEEKAGDIQEAEFDFVKTDDSDFGEEYAVYHRQHDLSVNWGSVEKMEVLSGTTGKGVLMFAHRRKRMEEVVSEQERHNKGLYLKAPSEPGFPVAKNIYNLKKMSDHSEPVSYMDRHIHQMNQQRSLVSNRTAKPFLGVEPGPAYNRMSAGPAVPVRKNPSTESTFKVHVPIISNPHVWSPTADIIASRDERIAIPAIRACSLPESRRKSSNKQHQTTKKQGSDSRENKAYMESEEDCFSLGAEACNFMQPRAIKLKNPPPVAPKPAINPKSPPWIRGPPSEPCLPPRSSISQAKYRSGPQQQHCYLDQHCSQPQKLANCSEADQAQATIQTPAIGRVSVSSSFKPHIQPTTTSRSKPLPRTAVSMQTHSPSFSPFHLQSTVRSKQESVPSSVASCPPKPMKPFTSKMPLPPPKGQVIGGGFDRTITDEGIESSSKRPSRMEKFVVGNPTSNQARCTSPTMSLPNSWRYSSNIRAPPPLSYNPLHSPFYTPPAVKKTQPTKTTVITKSSPKHLNTLDVMKHQPHYLDSSLFHYEAVPEAKSPSAKPAPPSKFEMTKKLKQRSAHSHSPNIPEPDFESKSETSAKSSAKSSGPGQGRSRSLSLPRYSSFSGPLSPVSTQDPRPYLSPAKQNRASSISSYKPPTPWEAASRSPFGSVDDAFLFQSVSSTFASCVRAVGPRRSLPEPPEEWKRRVSFDPPLASQGHCRMAPAYMTSAPMRMKSACVETTAAYRPSFRPSHSLKPAGKPRLI
ncbi:synaptopodin-2 [Corythoichthys intestinalis]|uniref:synaptopodin-2 n=1 Tax=Corythoichthys intestinalis TaxID=161448 RepID=UPI0025A5531C|nr:synaptopodin-2 [Corythoichthys intestinalis]XP_057698506.1 synaptopodin-2 [Corythoichthys intestinalis]XP_057698507.1 synaptopodin-2 [Corythoichthys intestinalis]XP_061791936.1 synaptopodin-2-like [Nerophis lumbriciformis]